MNLFGNSKGDGEGVPTVEEVGKKDGFDMFAAPDVNDVSFNKYGGESSKLEVINPNPKNEYRWVVNNPHNVREKFKLGYRLTQGDEELAVSDYEGGTPRLTSGREADGTGQELILMWRPKEFRAKQDELLRQQVKETQSQLDPTKAASDKGAGDATAFQGQVTIEGGGAG